jgi:glycosyltransferase involved in cell wall biosynthesis
VHVSSARTWRGGEQQVLHLAEGLQRLGARQRVVCPRGSAVEEACRARGLPHVAVPRRAAVDPLFAHAVARACAGLSARIVHAHDPHAHTAAVLSWSLFGNRTPVVVHRRVEFPIKRDPFTRWKYDHRAVARIVCVSRAISEVLRPRLRDPGRLRVIHSCVDLDRFSGGRSGAFRRELRVPDGLPLVGNVSALSASKDHLTWVDVVSLLERRGLAARYVVVGEGEERPRIEALIAERGLRDRIALVGFRRDVPTVMPDLDLFLFTSRAEGLGTTVLDAFAAGVPVVATRAGGIPEIVRDGESGLLAEPGDAAALADHVWRVLHDDALRERIVAGARATAADHAAGPMVRRTLELYREIVSGEAGAAPS